MEAQILASDGQATSFLEDLIQMLKSLCKEADGRKHIKRCGCTHVNQYAYIAWLHLFMISTYLVLIQS